MRLRSFKKFGFVLMFTGLCSCGSMEGAAVSTPIPTPVTISGMLSGSEPEKADVNVGKKDDAEPDLEGAEPTKLPVRDWEYWEGQGYTKEDLVMCDNDMITLKLLGWDAKNNRILLECQNKTNRDVYFSTVSDFYVDDLAVSSLGVLDFYNTNYTRTLHNDQSFWSDYYGFDYFGVPAMECMHFQRGVDTIGLYNLGMSVISKIDIPYKYGYYTEEDRVMNEYTFYPNGTTSSVFFPKDCSMVYGDENFQLQCAGKGIEYTEYTKTPYRVVYFIAEALTEAGECYTYGFECSKVVDGEEIYPKDSDYATKPFGRDAKAAGRKELVTVQAWELEEECDDVNLCITIKVHTEDEKFNYISTPLDVKYNIGVDGFTDGKVEPVVLKQKK